MAAYASRQRASGKPVRSGGGKGAGPGLARCAQKPDALERERQNLRGKADTRYPDEERGAEGERSLDPEAKELKEKTDDLRGRKLEDIEEEKEQKLRQKNLDDINVNVIPGEPMPPVLR